MRIEDRLRPRNTELHWAAYVLHLADDGDDGYIASGEVQERTEDVFPDVQTLTTALNTLVERGLADHEFDVGTDRYKLKSSGSVALNRLGRPTETPWGGEEYGYEGSPGMADTPGESETPDHDYDPATVPSEGEMVEASDGERVEFQRVRDDGTLVYHGEDRVLYYSDSPDMPPERQTVSLEPEWEWVGDQLAKLGHPGYAKRAYNEQMTPAEVYGPVLGLLYDSRHSADLDLGSYQPDALSSDKELPPTGPIPNTTQRKMLERVQKESELDILRAPKAHVLSLLRGLGEGEACAMADYLSDASESHFRHVLVRHGPFDGHWTEVQERLQNAPDA